MESKQCMLQLWRLALLVFFLSGACSAEDWRLAGGDRVESAAFYFSDFEENLQDLSLLGDAKFVRIEGQVDGMAVQLSGTRKNTVGRLLYSIPINLLDLSGNPASFSTFFEFSMTSFAGDGLAFVIAPDKTTIGASGPWLGLVKQDEISNKTVQAPQTFAVEFDSVMNTELQDPNSNHVGVDVETIVSTVTANASDMSVVLNDGSRTYSWIDYDGLTKVLEVRISKSSDSKPVSPLLTHRLDLSTVWKTWMYVGFSSSTGSASQKHKVFSWRFASGPPEAHVNSLHSLPADPSQVLLSSLHSIPVDPSAVPRKPEAEAPEKDEYSSTDQFKVDAGVLGSLLVGLTCGASLTLLLLAAWALISRRNSRYGEYEEVS